MPEQSILGPEAPLWSETLEDIDDIEFMAFPRMAGIAEIGWSPAAGRSWQEYRPRLAQQGPRWDSHVGELLPVPRGGLAVGGQAARSAATWVSTCAKAAGSCAPETPYLPSKT